MAYGTSSKRKGSLTVFLMLFLFILCIIPTLFVGVAFADGGGDSGGGDTGEGGAEGPVEPADVYYFTDYAGSSNLCYFLDSYSIGGKVARYYWNYNSFQEDFELAYRKGIFEEIFDRHIIFEMMYGLQTEIAGKTNFVFVLRDFFKELKERGCKIMFICGTDEALFSCSYDHTEFLDYVDIHINTDRMSWFLKSLLISETNKCKIAENDEENDGEDNEENDGENNEENDVHKLQNCTIILDKNFAPDIDPENPDSVKDCWSLKYRIFPYLSSMWNIPLNRDYAYKDLINNHNIKILCYMGDNEFYYVNEGAVIAMDDYYAFYYDYLENENIFAIGGTWSEWLYSFDWMNSIMDMQKHIAEILYINDVAYDFFPIYMYDPNGFFILETSYNDYITVGGFFYKSTLYEIVEVFLLDGDLTVYDNYRGRCDITHKLMKFGEGGWMSGFFGEDDADGFFDCWGAYMPEEEYTSLFGANSEEN